jgi:hypothetical protein
MLKDLFNAWNHFDVKTGRRTGEEVLSDFNTAVDLYVSARSGSWKARSEHFLRFFELISPAIENNNHFESFCTLCFRWNEIPRKG